ncbi:hypothetical protein K461DRAFT_282639 [Myriangium duriaei CBS 260.36]|uniref:Cerato-platanin n=1 Tax=Myriangium duriaei CBS 260.36 TaxID=1168546 RepID=A0A9P4IQH9_9PEZI|nr:hypothetical protein K461DRAFT_282639 [Myriangium duriaei CBS 260.36]
MLSTFVTFAGLLSLAAADYGVKTATFTPHVQYASSMGVLGCKINTNRVGYLPMWPGCDNLCYKIHNPATGNSVNILHVDSSAAAYDISADAFNYLVTGQGAKGNAVDPNPTTMEYSVVSMDQCYDIINGNTTKLPILAKNPDAVSNCIANEPKSWLANHYALYNLANSCCSYGEDVPCEFPDLTELSIPPTCGSSILGVLTPCTPAFENIGMSGDLEPAVC